MNKDYFLRELAENGYNVIYGAKKHFATYDTVEKTPGRIAFITLAIGIWQIYKPNFIYNQEVSLALIIASIVALTVNLYNGNKEKYRLVGNELIQLHNELRALYYKVKSSDQLEFNEEIEQMKSIMNQFYDASISKQVFLSDWLAHYKLFFQSQYEWIDEQKKFTWKDKIPVSFRIAVILAVICIILIFIF